MKKFLNLLVSRATKLMTLLLNFIKSTKTRSVRTRRSAVGFGFTEDKVNSSIRAKWIARLNSVFGGFKVLKYPLVALMVFVLIGCGDEPKTDADEPLNPLVGTKWVLIAVVEDNTNIPFKNIDNVRYTLFFETDYVAGQACNFLIGYYYIIDKDKLSIIEMHNATEMGCHLYNEDLYLELLNNVQSFIMKEDTLQLFYKNNESYLEFRRYY